MIKINGVKKPPKGSRRSVVLVFVGTLIASFAFWLYPEIPKIWQKISQPLIISNIVFQKKFDPSPVLEQIESLTKDLRGTYGVYIYRFADGREYGIRQEEIFPAASLMKLAVILTLYQEAEAGRINLVDKPVGSAYSYRQLAERMGKYSDNTANNILVKILGPKKIQETINNLGIEKTSFKDYKTTPEDIGLLFRKLYQDNLVNQVNREEILRFLTKTAFEDWIPAGLPVDTRVAHKIGKDIGTFSDGGIIFASPAGGQAREFILVIMSKNARESEAVAVLPKISKAVWEFETRP